MYVHNNIYRLNISYFLTQHPYCSCFSFLCHCILFAQRYNQRQSEFTTITERRIRSLKVVTHSHFPNKALELFAEIPLYTVYTFIMFIRILRCLQLEVNERILACVCTLNLQLKTKNRINGQFFKVLLKGCNY